MILHFLGKHLEENSSIFSTAERKYSLELVFPSYWIVCYPHESRVLSILPTIWEERRKS